jgi:autotransporter-associated beta strand protein
LRCEFLSKQHLGELLITAPVGQYGGTGRTASYVQAGPGTVVLSGVNTYTQPSYLNGGVTVISADSGLGAVGTGAQVNLNGGTLLSSASINLDNIGSQQAHGRRWQQRWWFGGGHRSNSDH